MKQDLPTNNMDSKVLISMTKLSQILAASGNDSHQVKPILIAVEGLSTSLKITDEPKSQELQKYVLRETTKEVNALGITSEGEQPEIKEFSIYMTIDPSCAQTTTQLEEDGLCDIVKEGEYQDYIERWFQEVTRPQYHSFIRHLLMKRKVSWLNFHIQAITAKIFSYVDKGTNLILLHT